MYSGRPFRCGVVLVLSSLVACSAPTGPRQATPTAPPAKAAGSGLAVLTNFTIDPAEITQGDSFTLSWKGEGAGATVNLARKGEAPFVVGLPLTGAHVLAAGQAGYPATVGQAVYEALLGDIATRKEATLTVKAVPTPTPTPLPTPTPTPTPEPCPNGRVWNGHCYLISATGMSWESGRAWCQSLDMEYAAINSQAENDFIVAYRNEIASNSYLWIGLNDLDHEGTFVWSNGDPVTYLNWASIEPDGSADCGCIYRASDDWYENPCSTGYRPICEGS